MLREHDALGLHLLGPVPILAPMGADERMYKQTNINDWRRSLSKVIYCVRMAFIKKTQIKNVSETVEKRNPLYTVGEKCNLVKPLWKIVGRFLKKLEIELPYDLTIPLLGIHPKKLKNINLKRYMCKVISLQLIKINEKNEKKEKKEKIHEPMQPIAHSIIYNSRDIEAV